MNGLNVEVSGSDSLARAAVISVVNDALVEKGFSDITQVNEVGESVPPQDQESLFAIIQRERPDVFATHITISEFETSSDDEDPPILSSEDTLVALNAPEVFIETE